MGMRGQRTRRSYRAAWRELGRLGRVAFLGVLVSGIVAVSLGFLVPAAVRDHLIAARVDELQRSVDTVFETAALAEFSPDADFSAFAAAARFRLLGGDTVRVKLWDPLGRVLWSDEQRLIGRRFNISGDLQAAFDAEVSVDEADLSDPETEYERDLGPLIEFYLPVTSISGEVEAVFEVYQRLEPFNETLAGVRVSTWIRIGSGLVVLMLFMGALTLVTLRGVERRRQESELLLRRSLKVRETERVRLASALHDDVGQPLYRLLYGLEALKDSQLAPDAAASEAERLAGLVRQVDDTLRDEMRRLQTSPVDQQGLESSLLALADDRNSPLVTNIEISIDSDRVLGSEVEEALYRTAREAVTNAAKHSEATKVDVRLTNVGDIATLSIVDNGKWQHGPEGLGITTVRGMLEAVGGNLEIRTKTGIGTTVVAQAPLKEQDQ